MGEEKTMQGEGNYEAARDYQKKQHEFARDDDKVEAKAKEAAEALEGSEGEKLEDARRKSGEGKTA